MRMSKMFVPTLKEVPADAEITSHQLMLRAGMVKKMSSGLYNHLPLGLRVFRKISDIIREEMRDINSNEIFCTGIIPAELWQESGRWDAMGQEMFRLKDRNGKDYCLGPTHEEVFTDIVRQEVKSYKDLPVSLYQIQAKYRDEIRPRFGVMRTKTFLMYDSYTFDVDDEGLDKSYQDMFRAYTNIFARCGLDNAPVQADSGAIGGAVSAEFMVKSEVGEDEIVFCKECDYAANIEKAVSVNHEACKEEMLQLEEVYTPSIKTIDQLQSFMNTDASKCAKTLIYDADGRSVVVVVRGDREVNDTKVANAIGDVIEMDMASAEMVKEVTGAETGFAGPIGIKADYLFIDQEIVDQSNLIVGANKTEYHIKNANYGRDFDGVVGNFRSVQNGDKCTKCGGELEIMRGVEVGHIFKLGTKYSEAMNCTFVDKEGKTKPIQMGCYGIGVERTAAAIVEQHNDENGIKWPLSVAPYHVIVVPVNMKKEEQVENSEKIYKKLESIGVETILDDRDERPGFKFKDAELIGIPMRITVGKDIVDGKVEFVLRETGEKELIALEDIEARVREEFKKNNVRL